eukprot:TRINITY_DN10641_c0_g1_i1.p1 TRINITY_DN10641_c0_g1~~TRINITY_DN10641_c0_g1_i1.p1  ORF type:complete len:197 (+),score=36.52 TRINITY_DN10641_c0_g1_i1:54-644(+)
MNSKILSLCLVLSSITLCIQSQPTTGHYNISTCTFTFNGKTVDLSPLRISGGYKWQQNVFAQESADITWNILQGHQYDPVPMYFEAQVCGNVNSQYDACKTPSPMNAISGDKKTCTYLGDINAASIDLVPYNDGFMITYYHGQYVNNIKSITSRIYMICDKTGNKQMFLEHEKSFHQWHFRLDNTYVCSLLDQLGL